MWCLATEFGGTLNKGNNRQMLTCIDPKIMYKDKLIVAHTIILKCIHKHTHNLYTPTQLKYKFKKVLVFMTSDICILAHFIILYFGAFR